MELRLFEVGDLRDDDLQPAEDRPPIHFVRDGYKVRGAG